MLSYLPKPAVTSVDADANDRWARGQILVLSGFGTRPAGIYAQDMVWAFGRISSGRASDSDVESQFESAFPGIPYVKATYTQQLQFYRKSSQREWDHAAILPRGPGGLWTDAWKAMLGYTTFSEHRKV
ncbi:hypothetical protein B0H13DRAFT_1920402 [Mycena leptocephala]|nr:hypothetical protein B0H13DRAFT_1920402 [Mycena leptocephala]